MHVVVTGSQSFIGRRFIAIARSRGVIVTGIDQVPGEAGDKTVDIRDAELVSAIPTGADAVVHLAAISRDVDCRNNPTLAFDVNVNGTLNVMRAAREQGCRQLIFASSEWVYGQAAPSDVQREDQPIDVTRIGGEYALSKIVGERLLAMEAERGFGNITILRFGIVYGPRAENWSAVESLFHQAATQSEIGVGCKATARRFIHVDDIASGIYAALGRSGFEIFNLSGDRLITLDEIVRTSGKIHGREPRLTESAPGTANVRNPDNEKACTTLDWRPAIDLESGLRSLLPDAATVRS